MKGKMDCYGLTRTGKVHDCNEDQFLIADLCKSMLIHQTSLSIDDHTRLFGGSQGKLLLVADGLSRYATGQRASTIAVDTIAHYVLNTLPWFLRLHESHEDDLKEELKTALIRCQESIERDASANPLYQQMSTTLTFGYIVWPRLYAVHVGDSRCYLSRGSHLEKVTTDHRQVKEQESQENSTSSRPGAPPESRWSYVLWNYLGGDSPWIHPEVYKASLLVGDTILLCTDGVTDYVRDEEIVDLLIEDNPAEVTCRKLIDAAQDSGSTDNSTVIVARFREPDVETADSEQERAVEQETVSFTSHI